MLISWRKLNKIIHELDEKTTYDMLLEEKNGENRASIVKRLYMHFNNLRKKRELEFFLGS